MDVVNTQQGASPAEVTVTGLDKYRLYQVRVLAYSRQSDGGYADP